MWYPNPAAARLYHDRQLRTLYACLGVSIALHGLAMLSFPALRPAHRPDETGVLSALFAPRAEPAAVAPVPASRRPIEQREAEPRFPLPRPADPAPVPTAMAPAPVKAPAPPPPAPTSLASSSSEAAAAPATPMTEAFDPSLFDAYRLALISAAKRYKRYPVQAMERGWEGRVEIRVVVDANGTVKSTLVKSSSRYQILDKQALDMVRRALDALTEVRPAPRGREFTVDVPVIFELGTG